MDSLNKVSEGHVIEAFHVLARQSLSDARSDGLIDEAFVQEATAEELQVVGPALTLLFAAWKTVSHPPCVEVPASSANPAFSLSISTCPSTLLPLFRRWQRCVPLVQKLSTEQAHDVARLLCDLEPQTSPVSTLMVKLAADLKALALQISQRRTFMERFTRDLEAALHREMPTTQQQTCVVPATDTAIRSEEIPLGLETAAPALPARYNDSNVAYIASCRPQPESAHPNIPETQNEDMIAVRETLYAVLADVLSQSSTLGRLLKEDPARGYFTAVALAVIEAAMNSLTPDGQRVQIVSLGRGRPTSFGVLDAPPAYRVFVRGIVGLGAVLKDLQEKDNARAIELATSGQEDNVSLTRMEMLKAELEDGPPDSDSVHDSELQSLREAAELRAVSNQVNRMALAVNSLPGFRDRVGVFAVLQGVSHGS